MNAGKGILEEAKGEHARDDRRVSEADDRQGHHH